MRRMSISSPRMTIESHFPWPVRLFFIACAIAAGGVAALWIYDMGRAFASGGHPASVDMVAYKEKIDQLSAQRDQYSTTVNSAENQLIIERSAQKQMARQVQQLESENTKLKEDLAFFESLLPTDTGSQEISIRRLKVDMVAPNQLRYRMLLMQGARGKNDFSGNFQLSVTALQSGRSTVLLFPAANAVAGDTEKFKLSFRHYQRLEGVLTLPDGVSVKSVQARVLEKGQMRTQLSANL
jgi:hypothetical protein